MDLQIRGTIGFLDVVEVSAGIERRAPSFLISILSFGVDGTHHALKGRLVHRLSDVYVVKHTAPIGEWV